MRIVNFPDPRLNVRDDGTVESVFTVNGAEEAAKPYSVRELRDRLDALMRDYPFAGDLDVIAVGPLDSGWGGPATSCSIDGLTFGPTYLYLGCRELLESEIP